MDHHSPCRSFFDRRSEIGNSFWEKLGESYPDCVCESVTVSEHSPGPVKDEETLVSVVTSDLYVSPDGKVEPTLFERRISNGISTDRKIYTSLEEFDRRAEVIVKGSDRKTNCGSIELSVAVIRAICHNGKRAIAVYDTALECNRSHAEIACTEIPLPGTGDRKKQRAALRKNVLDAALHDRQVLSSSQIFRVQ